MPPRSRRNSPARSARLPYVPPYSARFFLSRYCRCSFVRDDLAFSLRPTPTTLEVGGFYKSPVANPLFDENTPKLNVRRHLCTRKLVLLRVVFFACDNFLFSRRIDLRFLLLSFLDLSFPSALERETPARRNTHPLPNRTSPSFFSFWLAPRLFGDDNFDHEASCA